MGYGGLVSLNYPIEVDYFLIRYQMTGFSDFVFILGVFLGLLSQYWKLNNILPKPISMYSSISTLNINILKGIKNPPIRWYLFKSYYARDSPSIFQNFRTDELPYFKYIAIMYNNIITITLPINTIIVISYLSSSINHSWLSSIHHLTNTTLQILLIPTSQLSYLIISLTGFIFVLLFQNHFKA